MILLPYLLSAAYFAKLTFVDKQAFAGKARRRHRAMARAGPVRRGVQLLPGVGERPGGTSTVMSLLYAPGIVMYVKGRRSVASPICGARWTRRSWPSFWWPPPCPS